VERGEEGGEAEGDEEQALFIIFYYIWKEKK